MLSIRIATNTLFISHRSKISLNEELLWSWIAYPAEQIAMTQCDILSLPSTFGYIRR
jgi:hypothetical protein